MSAKLGNVNKFYVKVGTATDYTWLTGEQSNSVNRTQEAVEISDKSTDWAQFIGGKKGATVEVTLFADNGNAAQAQALKSLHNGTDLPFFVGALVGGTGADAGNPSDGEVGLAVVTNISDTNDFGAVASRTMSLTVNGPLTHYPTLT